MAVELEEISLWGLFHFNGKTFQIRAQELAKSAMLAPHLLPIQISWWHMCQLGFEQHGLHAVKQQWKDRTFYLKPIIWGRWAAHWDDGPRVAILQFVHEAQRLWYSLTGGHLHAKPMPPKEVHRSIGREELITLPYSKPFISIEQEVTCGPSAGHLRLELYRFVNGRYQFECYTSYLELVRDLGTIELTLDDVHVIKCGT